MNPDKHFTRAVAALPASIRERLSRDTPLDWSALEDPATGEALADAARAHGRLPATVEILVDRLVRDVGIVPANLAAGVERQGPAEEWSHEVAIEADGECYRLRDHRGGETHVGVRPEAVAGYAISGVGAGGSGCMRRPSGGSKPESAGTRTPGAGQTCWRSAR